jgi:hypothetical protein
MVVNRAPVYVMLTVTLVLTYTRSVVMLQALFRGLNGQSSYLAVMLSTLAAAGLFSPLRRQIRTPINRRFHRQES